MLIFNKLIVNRRTYLKELILKGNIACTKKSSEIMSKVGTEIGVLKVRITNLNPLVGYGVPHSSLNVWGIRYYVVYLMRGQSKQPADNFSYNGEKPKSITNRQNLLEFGISRNMKMWGRRRTRSTTIICGKGSSRFMINKFKFEGLNLKYQINNLKINLKLSNDINNLTTILSNEEYLIGCYNNLVSQQKDSKHNLNFKNLSKIDLSWFNSTCNSFRNGTFSFRPFKRTLKSKGKLKTFIVPSFEDRIVQEGIGILLEAVFKSYFNKSSRAFLAGKGCHTVLNEIRSNYGKVKWFIKGNIKQKHLSNINLEILIKTLREKVQDEPFIDLIYKYFKSGFGEKIIDEVLPIKFGNTQNKLLPSILLNIYMHSFDIWVNDFLIPKHKLKNKKQTYCVKNKANFTVNDKTIQTIKNGDENSIEIHYVRYVNNFLIGVQGSKKKVI